MNAMPAFWLQPVNQHNAKIVVTSGKPVIVMNEHPQSWESFWQGTLTGSIPSMIAGFVWLRGLIKERLAKRDILDQGFREYLMNENMQLKQEMKELRANFGSLQLEVGKAQQAVDKVSHDKS